MDISSLHAWNHEEMIERNNLDIDEELPSKIHLILLDSIGRNIKHNLGIGKIGTKKNQYPIDRIGDPQHVQILGDGSASRFDH